MVIVHHTWKPTAADYQGIETVRGVRRYHMEKGWSDNGYNKMVGPSGEIFDCRPIERAGAHCKGQNSYSIGISYIADFDAQEPATYAGLAAGQQIVAALCERFDLEPEDVYFHRDFAHKSCPGNKMNRADYRDAVRQFMSNGLKVVLLPGSEPIACRPQIEDGVTRVDLRSLAEALGYEVITDHLADQNKIYLRQP